MDYVAKGTTDESLVKVVKMKWDESYDSDEESEDDINIKMHKNSSTQKKQSKSDFDILLDTAEITNFAYARPKKADFVIPPKTTAANTSEMLKEFPSEKPQNPASSSFIIEKQVFRGGRPYGVDTKIAKGVVSVKSSRLHESTTNQKETAKVSRCSFLSFIID
jgi:hypothetical protein